jgi:hypothetical protein
MRRASRLLLAVVATLFCAAALRAQSTRGPITRVTRPVRLLHSWYDSIKTPEGEVPRRVDILFDYRHARALEQWYTLDGRLFWSRTFVVNPPTASEEEIEEAFDIVRADPEMIPILRRFSAVLDGGFVIEEGRGKACGPGARCLLIQVLSPDRSGLIRAMGVDLVKRNIPYPTFVPSEHPGVK